MKNLIRTLSLIFLPFFASLLLAAQQPKPAGLLGADEVKKAVPATYFFRGQSATVQLRNSAGIRAEDGKLVLAALLDTSGYATAIAEKCQGLLITEVKLDIEGSVLAPGAYGFGFAADGKFVVMDVGANDVLSVAGRMDEKLPRPVPLKIVADSGAYRLYAGKKWVGLKMR